MKIIFFDLKLLFYRVITDKISIKLDNQLLIFFFNLNRFDFSFIKSVKAELLGIDVKLLCMLFKSLLLLVLILIYFLEYYKYIYFLIIIN